VVAVEGEGDGSRLKAPFVWSAVAAINSDMKKRPRALVKAFEWALNPLALDG
jgi:hypothetical protein